MKKIFASLLLVSTPLIYACSDYMPIPVEANLIKKSGSATTATELKPKGIDDLTVLALAGKDTLEISAFGDNIRSVYELNRLLDENTNFRIPLNYFDNGVKFYFDENNKGEMPASEFYFD